MHEKGLKLKVRSLKPAVVLIIMHCVSRTKPCFAGFGSNNFCPTKPNCPPTIFTHSDPKLTRVTQKWQLEFRERKSWQLADSTIQGQRVGGR